MHPKDALALIETEMAAAGWVIVEPERQLMGATVKTWAVAVTGEDAEAFAKYSADRLAQRQFTPRVELVLGLINRAQPNYWLYAASSISDGYCNLAVFGEQAKAVAARFKSLVENPTESQEPTS